MMQLNFQKDQPFIAREFTDREWDASTGLPPEILRENCSRLWAEAAGEPIMRRRALLTSHILDNARLDMRPFDCFADQLQCESILNDITMEHFSSLLNSIEPQLSQTADAQACRVFTGDHDFGHTCPDWRAVLTLGLPGLLGRLRAAREQAGAREQAEFYDPCIQVYEAMLRAVRRMADHAASLAPSAPRMAEIAENLRELTLHAPETLWQALELSLLIYLLQHDVERAYLRSLGRFDLLYQPFYEADLAAGRITREEAKELLQYYFWRWNARNVTANIPITLCGRDEQGREVGSDFTKLVLEAYGELNIISPKFHIRVTPGMREDVLVHVLSLIRDGRSSFVFCNDDVVEQSMQSLGHTPGDARDYIMIGCYESTSMGRELACTCNGRISFTKAVEYALTGGMDLMSGLKIGCDTPTRFDSFDSFLDAVRTQLTFLADRCMSRISLIECLYPDAFASAALSSTMESCVLAGRDAYSGAAKYNHSSINAFGLATAADALAAVRYLVFEKNLLTTGDLAEILLHDWENHEKLRLIALKRAPKYGVNDARTDALARDLIETAARRINGSPNGRGGTFRTGAFSIDWRYDFGRHTAASADGRRAGEPLSKNLSATLGMDTEGATALIQSASCFDGTLLANGTVLDVVLHESAVSGGDGMAAMLGLIRAFMKNGGLAIQLNVLSADTLRRAQAEPEKYPTLQVRLCGWNVLFVNLSKAEQDELIRQAESA